MVPIYPTKCSNLSIRRSVQLAGDPPVLNEAEQACFNRLRAGLCLQYLAEAVQKRRENGAANPET